MGKRKRLEFEKERVLVELEDIGARIRDIEHRVGRIAGGLLPVEAGQKDVVLKVEQLGDLVERMSAVSDKYDAVVEEERKGNVWENVDAFYVRYVIPVDYRIGILTGRVLGIFTVIRGWSELKLDVEKIKEITKRTKSVEKGLNGKKDLGYIG